MFPGNITRRFRHFVKGDISCHFTAFVSEPVSALPRNFFIRFVIVIFAGKFVLFLIIIAPHYNLNRIQNDSLVYFYNNQY